MNRVIVTSVILGAAVSAHADVLLNTFGLTGSGFTNTGWSVNNGQYMGRAFNSPGSYTLSEIDIALFGGAGDSVTVNLCADGGGVPGSVLESFVVGVDGTPTKYFLNSVSHPLLTTGTYFLTVVPTTSSVFGAWCQTNDAHTAAMVFSTNQGGSWNGFTDTDGAVTVMGNLVPEPASLAVLGVGALALLRRRKRA